jgi:hypothetical protein
MLTDGSWVVDSLEKGVRLCVSPARLLDEPHSSILLSHRLGWGAIGTSSHPIM